MYPRTSYEMTKEDLEKILAAIKPVPMIMVGSHAPRSQQERANDAWGELGKRMGFDHMTVQPTGKGDQFFTAIPSETELHKKERLAREAKEKRQTEIAELSAKIVELRDRRAELIQRQEEETPND